MISASRRNRGPALGPVGMLLLDLLEGDLAVELLVAGQEDHAQAPLGVEPHDLEALPLAPPGAARGVAEDAGGRRIVVASGSPCFRMQQPRDQPAELGTPTGAEARRRALVVVGSPEPAPGSRASRPTRVARRSTSVSRSAPALASEAVASCVGDAGRGTPKTASSQRGSPGKRDRYSSGVGRSPASRRRATSSATSSGSRSARSGSGASARNPSIRGRRPALQSASKRSHQSVDVAGPGERRRARRRPRGVHHPSSPSQARRITFSLRSTERVTQPSSRAISSLV